MSTIKNIPKFGLGILLLVEISTVQKISAEILVVVMCAHSKNSDTL